MAPRGVQSLLGCRASPLAGPRVCGLATSYPDLAMCCSWHLPDVRLAAGVRSRAPSPVPLPEWQRVQPLAMMRGLDGVARRWVGRVAFLPSPAALPPSTWWWDGACCTGSKWACRSSLVLACSPSPTIRAPWSLPLADGSAGGRPIGGLCAGGISQPMPQPGGCAQHVLAGRVTGARWPRSSAIAGCSPPLPEVWCRGARPPGGGLGQGPRRSNWWERVGAAQSSRDERRGAHL